MSRRILIADDEADSRQALKDVLSHWGYEVLRIRSDPGLTLWVVIHHVSPPCHPRARVHSRRGL